MGGEGWGPKGLETGFMVGWRVGEIIGCCSGTHSKIHYGIDQKDAKTELRGVVGRTLHYR